MDAYIKTKRSCLDFADDVSLLLHLFQHMQQKTESLQTVARSTGLEINTTKTKCLRINAQNDSPLIQDVDSFTYLGSIVIKTGGADQDIKSRIGKARHAFVTLRAIWKSSNINLKTKIRIFEKNVKSFLLYGSETWKQTKKNEHDLQVFVNKCLRQLLKIRWHEKISNQDLWKKTNQNPISDTIKKRKWRWIGHILRREQGNITKHALDVNPPGKRKRGRPVTTWRRLLDNELRSIQMSWGEAKRAAHDRDRWRAVVEALYPSRASED